MNKRPLTTYIHLLRGINVGGHKKIPMALLKTCYEELGLKNVQTYIQSGNVVFQTHRKTTTQELERSILDKTTFEVPTMLFTAEEWKDVVQATPDFFKENSKEIKCYITLLERPPNQEDFERVKSKLTDEEELLLHGRALYIHYPASLKKPLFSNVMIEKGLKQRATTRNWNTVNALSKMTS